MYARAKEQQAEAYVDEIMDISDDSQGDAFCDEYGNVKPNHEFISRSRLRVDTRKWFASKVLPKKYGDKLDPSIQIPGAPGSSVEIKFVEPKPRLDDAPG